MKNIFRHITRLLSLLLLMHVFVINTHAQTLDDDDDDILDGHPEAALFEHDNDITPEELLIIVQSPPEQQQQITHGHHSKPGGRVFSHISFDIINKEEALPMICILSSCTKHNFARDTRYHYLFYKEINPPPPEHFLA